MTNSLLKIRDLSVEYSLKEEKIRAVDKISLSLHRGQSLGIIGESGSGKTSMALALMGLIKKTAKVDGQILINTGDSYKDINLLEEKELNSLRWEKLAIVFQNSLDVLNPVLTIYEQIYEVLDEHTDLDSKKIHRKIMELLDQVGLEPEIANSYPHQLSGGMRQRVLIAMGISCDPEILIVDEPTSALDMISKNEIIKLLAKLQKEKDFAMLLISHELDTVLQLTSEVCVMYDGSIVEKGITREVINNPSHMYTRGLLNSSPLINPFGDMWGIPHNINTEKTQGCSFMNRCTQSIDICKSIKPSLEAISKDRFVACHRGGIVTILKGEAISKSFLTKERTVRACHNCYIEVRSGEIVALIGESGSGKTTLASILAGIMEADQGRVFFEDQLVSGNNFTSRENGIQMVFQDPFSAINENLSIREIVEEPLKIMKRGKESSIEKEIRDILMEVQLDNRDEFLNRRAYTLSGGQRQRVSLARSLLAKPKLLIADEISSMLDPSTQANILRLLKELQNKKGFSMIYITHDLAVARKIADRIYVMENAEIVENGVVSQIFTNPEKDYTKKLIGEALTIY